GGGFGGGFHEVFDPLLEFGGSQCLVKVLGPGRIGGDEREVQLRFGSSRQLALGALGGFFKALEREPVGPEVYSGFFLESLNHPVDDSLIEVFSAEERVAAGGQHFEDAVAHFHYGYVKGSAAQIVNRNFLAVLLAQAVSEGRCSRLVNDSLDIEAGDLARVLGGLALDIVE